jgi:hypothetical protein
MFPEFRATPFRVHAGPLLADSALPAFLAAVPTIVAILAGVARVRSRARCGWVAGDGEN